MASNLGPILDFEKPVLELEQQIEELKQFAVEKGIDMAEQVTALENKAQTLRVEIYANLTTWQRVQIVRHPKRPTCLDYIGRVFHDFVELHGDRLYGDDPALV